ncbi:MAG: CopG family ribbon-helix-helix protein [Pseudomonadota bacterium]
MTAAATRPVAIKIDPEMKERVKRLADARHRTPHWLMCEAITQYVEREEKREAFRQDAIKAWEEYQVTGRHATAEEVDAWLAKIEEGQDAKPSESRA